MWPLLGAALAAPRAPLDPACGDLSAVTHALAERAEVPIARQTEAAWADNLRDTCAWAGSLAAEPHRACITAACVRRVSEDRLAVVSSAVPSGRAADLLRATGRDCPPDRGRTCAVSAVEAEDGRLALVVSALQQLGAPAVADVQRSWFVYRDTTCGAEAASAGPDGDWSRAACGAALAVRRADLLADLLRLARPDLGARLDGARYDAAVRALRPRGRPWDAWLDAVDPDAWARDALREAAEARVDGAWFPLIVRAPAFDACTAHDERCWQSVRAAIRPAPRQDTAPEAVWRAGWCGRSPGGQRVACDAEIDWIIARTEDDDG